MYFKKFSNNNLNFEKDLVGTFSINNGILKS